VNQNEFWKDVASAMRQLSDWCLSQGFKDFCSDQLQVSQTESDAHQASSYKFTGAVGITAVFFAFSDIENFSWFCLRWGYVAS
jgi:hypothetical protein